MNSTRQQPSSRISQRRQTSGRRGSIGDFVSATTLWASTMALVWMVSATVALSAAGAGAESDSRPPHPGLQLLLEEPLSFSPFSVDELNRLWTTWEEPARSDAESMTPDQRRAAIFRRYGLIERPEGDATGLPLGYTADDAERLYPNCLSCHGGAVAGRTIPGLANNQQDLTALVGDLAALRAADAGGNPEVARRSATLGFPLNFSRGTSNATMYSILLGSMRDEHLDVMLPPKMSQEFVHNSIDAPPWWHFKRKQRIYWDGMAPKTVRTLMQFTMAPGLPGEKIRSWEGEFEQIRDYIESIEPPDYPFPIDRELAAVGEVAFRRVCTQCHGTYGAEQTYPERRVAHTELGTDPTRLEAIRPESKRKYNRGWFSNYGEHPVDLDVSGYVAPPLDGIWASAPYLHNGSVPTLWHLLHPDQRPVVWRRRPGSDTDAYDERKVGLSVDELDEIPTGSSGFESRWYYDTRVPSQDDGGHRFPEELTAAERRAVLEYLKTL